MRLAVPKERQQGECRVAATPETVVKLTSMGFVVRVERGKLRVDLRALLAQLCYSVCFHGCERRAVAGEGRRADDASSSSSCHGRAAALHARRAVAYLLARWSCNEKGTQQAFTITSVAYHGRHKVTAV